MATLTIPVDRIKDVIGSQGKVINDIIAKCDNVKIDIDDDGKVVIYHMDREPINKAKEMIENIVKEAKVGEVYDAKVVRIESYGAFVNLFGNVDGLCHVSQLANERVNQPKDVVKLGQILKVRVTEIDEKGRINVSHKEFAPKVEKKPVEKKETKVEEAAPVSEDK